MITSARRLLGAVDRLPFGERQRLAATTARTLDAAGLDAMLRDLDGRGEFARRLALHMARAAGHRGYVERCLSAEQTGVVGHALGVAVAMGLPAPVFSARLPLLPTALRRTLYSAIRRHHATSLADELLPVVREVCGDRETAMLLVACTAPVVAAALPELEHAVSNWASLARRHPVLFLDFVTAELDATPVSWWPRVWARLGTGMATAALSSPSRVLDLVERVVPHAELPGGFGRTIGALARRSPGQMVRILVHPKRTGNIPGGRALWRALADVGDDELVALARTLENWRIDPFLRQLAPSRRPAVYHGASRGRNLFANTLYLLPAAARAEEGRKRLARRDVANNPNTRLTATALLGWDEAREPLHAATRRAAADDRAAAYSLYVEAAAASRDPETFGAMLRGLTRLTNEQDPVRWPALTALSEVPGWLFRPAEAAVLTQLMIDATEARDCSWNTQQAVGTLALTLVREGAVTLAPELVDAGMTGLEGLGQNRSGLQLSRLDRMLPHGAEHRVFEALRPRITTDAARGRYWVLLSLAEGLGRRARRLPQLQDLLGHARSAKDDSVVRQAIRLWLQPPATRDERVAEVFAADRSTITISEVREAIGFRRTDLLDDVIGRRLHGRFLKRGVRHVPDFAGCFGRWLPRQVSAYAEELTDLATSSHVSVYERANAVRSLARVPGTVEVVRGFVDDGQVQVAEAALAALAWTDEPGDVLDELLAHADSDRARVAVHALGRCARYLTPDRLGALVRPLVTGPKVTARKEAVRLLAEHRTPDVVATLSKAWHGHRDVKRALVSATRWFLDSPAAWDLLARAAASEEEVATALLGLSPLTIARQHRARYAALVRTVASSPDPDTARAGLVALPRWSRWDSGGPELLVDRVTDLGNTATWSDALLALTDLCATTEDFTPLRATTAALLAHGDDMDAAEDRDLPARQRIHALARNVCELPALRTAAGVLASDLAGTHRKVAVGLAVAAVPWDADPLDGLRLVARLADRPALAAHARSLLELDPVLRRLPDVWSLASALALEGSAGALLALAVTVRAGADEDWPERWRALLRSLRAHPDPEVRDAALETFTTIE